MNAKRQWGIIDKKILVSKPESKRACLTKQIFQHAIIVDDDLLLCQ